MDDGTFRFSVVCNRRGCHVTSKHVRQPHDMSKTQRTDMACSPSGSGVTGTKHVSPFVKSLVQGGFLGATGSGQLAGPAAADRNMRRVTLEQNA